MYMSRNGYSFVQVCKNGKAYIIAGFCPKYDSCKVLSTVMAHLTLQNGRSKALFTRRPSFPCARDISGPRDTDSSSLQANLAE